MDLTGKTFKTILLDMPFSFRWKIIQPELQVSQF